MRPRPRWLSFSLKSVFVILTILGLMLGWIIAQFKWIHDRNQARVWIGQHGELISEEEADGPHSGPVLYPFHAHAPWGTRIFEEEGVSYIHVVTELSKKQAYSGPMLKSLFPEALVEYFCSDDDHGWIFFTTWIKVRTPSGTKHIPQGTIGGSETLDHKRRALIQAMHAIQQITSLDDIEGFGARVNKKRGGPETEWHFFDTDREARAWLRKAIRVQADAIVAESDTNVSK